MYVINKKVLIIDNDFRIYREIKELLQKESIYVDFVPVYDIMEQVNQFEVCLIIINLKFTGGEYLKLVKRVQRVRPVPILVLSAQNYVKRVDVFHAGAHGYLEQPYTREECAAYAHSLISLYWKLKKDEKNGYALVFDPDFLIDPIRHQAVLNGKMQDLTPREFDLLYYLASYSGQILSRRQLFRAIWNESDVYNVDELIKAHIKSIRKKMAPYGKEYIQNVRGIGYRFTLILRNSK